MALAGPSLAQVDAGVQVGPQDAARAPSSVQVDLPVDPGTTLSGSQAQTGPVALRAPSASSAGSLQDGVLLQSFADATGAQAISAAWDGSFHYTTSGGSNGGNRFARYLPNGTLDITFASGIDFRGIITDNAGNLFATEFGSPNNFYSITSGGVPTLLFTIGGPNSQSNADFNGPDTELYSRDLDQVFRWNATTGAPLGSFTLIGMGGGELVHPDRYQLETTAAGRILTYSDNVVSEWDLAGNRIGTSNIPGGPHDDWSFGMGGDNAYLLNLSTNNWDVFDIGASSGGGKLNFDEDVEPCTFNLTTALRAKYASQGINFDGPASLDGGAILDECGNFGVTGHSAPNFLAFNAGASMSNGGIPRDPETIKFDFALSFVQILAGFNGAGTITLEAFDVGGNSLGSDSLVGAAALAPLSVTASGIRSVVITQTGNIMVLDDLCWDSAGGPVTYCTAKTGLVCGIPAIGFSGAPQAGATSGFTINAGPARGLRTGLVLYSCNGRANFPFQGGILCVNPAPLRRSTIISSGGTNGGCDGVFAIDFNTFATGGLGGNPDACLGVSGQQVNGQVWGRDSVATGSFLSDALEFNM